VGRAVGWAAGLSALTAAVAALHVAAPAAALPVLAGLMAFGAVFAVNSALHSYLILSFAGRERVTMDVGVYYGANAAGRLLGTVLSGVCFQLGGLGLSLGASAVLLAVAAAVAATIPRAAPEG
jgi:hypothetical protein